MTKDEHKAHHIRLHKALDELMADYLRHNPKALLSRNNIFTLAEWSAGQMDEPTETDE